MRILILSFYFQPDLSAGAFRATALAEELSKILGPDDLVEVLTTMPNRYHSYHIASASEEQLGNLIVRRIPLPQHQSGMIDQSRAFMSYARTVLDLTRRQTYDVVFATSSRLMTAVLGARIARRTGGPLYLDLRDIFPDTLKDILRPPLRSVMLPPFRGLERLTLKTASRVNLVSLGFLDYFKAIRSDLEYRTFTNGIDEAFIGNDFAPRAEERDTKVILYAGNIGEGQGLERIVPGAALALGKQFEFVIVGDGGTRSKLEAAITERAIPNVRIAPPVSRDRLIELYRDADYLFLHLNDYPAFHKVLPSKIFEYAATGKPIVAGVAGYARCFIEGHIENAVVFAPCDSQGFVRAIGLLSPHATPRTEFIQKFRRSNIINRMARDILDLVG